MEKKWVLLSLGMLILFSFPIWCWNNTWETVSVNLDISVSQYCEDNGWTSEFMELPDWNELWTCFFVDGSFCDVWDYKDWNCKRWDNPVVVAKVSELW